MNVVGLLLPPIAETPAGFPATVLYDFRIASIGGQVVLWTVIALVFGALIVGRSRQGSTSAPGAGAR